MRVHVSSIMFLLNSVIFTLQQLQTMINASNVGPICCSICIVLNVLHPIHSHPSSFSIGISKQFKSIINSIFLILLESVLAFDNVPHNSLLLKMKHYDIRNKTFIRIKSWLLVNVWSIVEQCKSKMSECHMGLFTPATISGLHKRYLPNCCRWQYNTHP